MARFGEGGSSRRSIEVPDLPDHLAALIEATVDRETTIAELGRLVALEPSFAVKVLKLVNASLHTRGNPIASIHKAVTRLGVHSLRNLALATAATGGADAKVFYPFDLNQFWEESLRRAAACEVLAESGLFGRIPEAHAFTAGMMQDLAVLCLVRSHPSRAEQWMNLIGEPPERRRREERKIFGASHEEVALEIAEKWHLPEDIALPMIHHHRPENAPDEYRRRCRMHELAEYLAAVYGADDTAEAWAEARRRLAPYVRDGGDDLVDALIEKVGRRVVTAARSLGMMVPDQPDLDRLRRLAARSAEMGELSRRQLVTRVKRLLARNDGLHRDLLQARAMVEMLSALDELTSLPNARALEARMAQEIRRAARTGAGLALVALAVQPVGRRLDPLDLDQLIGVGIGATMRVTDLVARTGLGRFEMLLPDTTPEGAFVAARRALAGVRGETGDAADGDWQLRFGLACLVEKPEGKPEPDALIVRMRARARRNIAAAMEARREVVRTGREVIGWVDEDSAEAA